MGRTWNRTRTPKRSLKWLKVEQQGEGPDHDVPVVDSEHAAGPNLDSEAVLIGKHLKLLLTKDKVQIRILPMI